MYILSCNDIDINLRDSPSQAGIDDVIADVIIKWVECHFQKFKKKIILSFMLII